MKRALLNPLGCMIAAAILWHTQAASGASPPATMFVEPQDGGKLVYLPVAPETDTNSASSLLGLWITITNTHSSDEIILTSISLSYSESGSKGGAGTGFVFPRNKTLAAGKSDEVILDKTEAIQLPYPPPETVLIQCTFKGYDVPLEQELKLAPYVAPTPTGAYLWPGRRDDLTKGRVWVNKDRHNGGDEFFGHDLHVQAWLPDVGKYARYEEGTDHTLNAHDFGWGLPIYAMADGIVAKAVTDWINNPGPGKYAIQPRASITEPAVEDVAAIRLDENLVATAVALPGGPLRIQLRTIENDGQSITPGASTVGALGDQVSQVWIAKLSAGRVVTASKLLSGDIRLDSWNVTSSALTHVDSRFLAPVNEFAIVGLTVTYFATATVKLSGETELTAWDFSMTDTDTVVIQEAATSLSLEQLSTAGRMTLARRDPAGILRLTIWDYSDANGLEKRGEVSGSSISQVDSAMSTASSLITAVRTDDDKVRVLKWTVSADGNSIAQAAEGTAEHPISVLTSVMVVPRDADSVLTCSVTPAKELRLHYWELNDAGTAYKESGGRVFEAGDKADLTSLTKDAAQVFGAYRNDAGRLRMQTWRIANHGGGNALSIIHGNCLVHYSHLKAGSIDPALLPGAPVKAGQQLGEMGNSGNSTGPHLHLEALRLTGGYSVEEIIANEAAGNAQLHRGPYRPIPFSCARVWNLKQLNAQDSVVGSTLLDRMGIYFVNFAIIPTWSKEAYVDGSSTCQLEVGRQDCVSPPGVGAYHTVNNALQDGCWGPELFIRAGHYDESILVDRGMILRAYDGRAVIGAP